MTLACDIFSYLCGQQRCFIVDGSPLPLCQRCLGLYVGAALTAGWLLGTGLWRRAFPPAHALLLHGVLLLAAMLGGMHILDPGPAWRMLCGLYTGHIGLLWLGFATRTCRAQLRPDAPRLRWSRPDLGQLYTAPALLALLAGVFPQVSTGYYVWVGLAFIGSVALLLAACNALRTLACTLWRVFGKGGDTCGHGVRSAITRA